MMYSVSDIEIDLQLPVWVMVDRIVCAWYSQDVSVSVKNVIITRSVRNGKF